MHIVVTVKQVPDPDIPPSHFKVDEANNRVIPPSGVAPVMNGYDANALEAALRLKEVHGGEVTVLSLGAAEARDTLKRALAMGATKAVLLSDPAFDGLDSLTTARVLAAAITKIGEFDLVLCGRQASDTDAGQVPLGIAGRPSSESTTISARSRTRKRSSTFRARTPSSNMVTQKGQATATPRAGVASASLSRLWLIRSPRFSSMKARAPPAPQQKPLSRQRGSSRNLPSACRSTSRGGS